MSSEPFRRPVLLLALVASLLLPACGKKGDPMPPLRVVPQKIDDLAYVQQGEVVTLRMAYPATTVAGETLGGIEAVEIWSLTLPVEDPERPPQVVAPQIEGQGALLARLQGAELQSATRGGEIVARLPLGDEGAGDLHAYAVRTVAVEGEASELSNIVTVIPAPAPPAPESLALEPGGEGIRVRWQAAGDGFEGFHVYRRLAFERGYGDPLAFVQEGESHLDETARFGERYIYTVTAVASLEPRRESAFATEREIRFEDRFPPAPPIDLVALPEASQVRLVWKASPSPDTIGYLVYRADPTGSFRALEEEPITEPEYRDTGLVGGLTYEYRVTAVDGEGNESAPSATVEAVPR